MYTRLKYAKRNIGITTYYIVNIILITEIIVVFVNIIAIVFSQYL